MHWRLVEQRVSGEQEQLYRRRLDDEVARLAQEGAVGMHRRRVQEELLLLRCPRCQAPFLDFTGCALPLERGIEGYREESGVERGQSGRAAADGEDRCFALQCGSCPCNFCAVCLHDCGTDAHAHVATCGETGVLGWVPPPRSLSFRSLGVWR